MIRGTTPKLVFTFPFDTREIDKLYFTLSQNDDEILTVDQTSCEFDAHTVSINLSQQQTLLLKSNSYVDMQFRVVLRDSMALASNIMKTSVQRLLKDGEI